MVLFIDEIKAVEIHYLHLHWPGRKLFFMMSGQKNLKKWLAKILQDIYI